MCVYVNCIAACKSGKLIVSRYVAESITTDAGRFGRVGLCSVYKTSLACMCCVHYNCVSTCNAVLLSLGIVFIWQFEAGPSL